MDSEIASKLDAILARLDALEGRVDTLSGRIPQVDEETLMAISAAVAAYMGVKAKVRAIHYSGSSRWASAGRRTVHTHDVR